MTAGDVAHALPDPAVVRRVQAYFRDQGFEVGRPFATSFSLVGRRSAFAATFGPAAGEFDLSRLPAEIRDAVQAVVLTPPPAFGPGNP